MSPLEISRGLFLFMKKLILFISTCILLFSCGNDTKNNIEVEVNPVDSTSTLQIQEFKAINAALKNDINNPALYLRRAKLYMKYDDLGSAVNDMDRAIKVDSLVPAYYLLKAELLKKQNKLKESKDALDKCMMIDNDNLTARIELGWLALIAKEYDQAMDYADAVLKRQIHSAEAYYLKGMIFEEKLDTLRAISSFKTAVEQENDYYDAYIHLGLLHFNEPNNMAKDYLKNALRIDPKSLEALYAYAMNCQMYGEFDEAIATYQKILEIGEYREPYFNLGYIHQVHLKDYKVAVENYTKAIEIEPGYIDAYYNRGLSYEQLDMISEAEKDLGLALKLSPEYTNAALALERVLKQK